jgi:hypothetical protein
MIEERSMNRIIRTNIDNLWTDDRDKQNKAYSYILKATDKPVDWAYEVWDELLANLSHKDSHNRAIAAQVLSNLAKSDPKNRMLKDFDKLLTVNLYGKSAWQETNNRKFIWRVLSIVSRNVLLKRIAP